MFFKKDKKTNKKNTKNIKKPPSSSYFNCMLVLRDYDIYIFQFKIYFLEYKTLLILFCCSIFLKLFLFLDNI